MSLKHEDLKGTVLPEISIDEYEPKAGDDRNVIVVAFHVKDEPPANDLNTFIQRGSVDTLDVEVSPNTDEQGRYLVFVEMSRNETFPNKFQALLLDVENLTGKMDWEIETYFSNGVTFSQDDPTLYNYLILKPEAYVTKDEFKMTEMKESINDFFKDSLITSLTIDEGTVIVCGNNKQIIAEVVDVGDYDDVIGRNFLSESAFGVGQNNYEASILSSILGDCHVLPLGKFLCVNKGDRVMLLRDTQIKYGN
jgi:hypothetical protein